MKLFKRPKQELPKRRLATPQEAVLDDASTFRRGRTLTGSASSLVRSTNEAQADLKSSRVHAHELRKKRRRLAGGFFAIVVVATLLYVLMSQFTARVVVQASPDPSLQLDAAYSEAIDDYFSDHFGERFRLLTNTDQLGTYLQSVTPEVKSVKLRGGAGFGASLFELSFREPIASWDIHDRQLYVDASGVPFERNYFSSPTLRITDKSGMSSVTTPGQSVMSNRFMSYIGQVIGRVREQGYAVSTIVIPEGVTRQIEVHLEGVPYPSKLSSDRSAGEGVDDMVMAIRWMEARGLTPEYVDVRVASKVYYK